MPKNSFYKRESTGKYALLVERVNTPLMEEYKWAVATKSGLYNVGYCSSYSHAFRALRNFIRHNQNEIYQ